MYFLGTSVLNSEFDMSDSNTSSGNGNNKTQKRNLPSWMTSSENESNSHGKKPTDTDENEEYQKDEKTKQAKGRDKAHNGSSLASSLRANNFSKLLVLLDLLICVLFCGSFINWNWYCNLYLDRKESSLYYLGLLIRREVH